MENNPNNYSEKEIEEMQKKLAYYKELEDRLEVMFGGQMSLEEYVNQLIISLAEPGKAALPNCKILTYEDAEEWEAYKECRKNYKNKK